GRVEHRRLPAGQQCYVPLVRQLWMSAPRNNRAVWIVVVRLFRGHFLPHQLSLSISDFGLSHTTTHTAMITTNTKPPIQSKAISHPPPRLSLEDRHQTSIAASSS